MTETTDLYERQRIVEFDCVMLGQRRYEEARVSVGESGTKPGKYQTRATLPALADAIRAWLEAVRAGGAGRRHTSLGYLLHVEPEQAAYLTLRYVLDGASSMKSFTAIAVDVGTAIEDHVNVLALSDEAPGLYRKVMEQLKQSTAARHRMGVWRKVSQRYAKERLVWSKREKARLGSLLIELMEASTTLIRTMNARKGPRHTRKMVLLTDEAVQWFANEHMREATFAPLHLPMLVPPRDWCSPFNGGYLTSAIRGALMIQTRSMGFRDEVKNVDMPAVYDALNIVQATPWRINRAVLATMTEASQLGDRYQALFVEQDTLIPARPSGIPTDVPMENLTTEQRAALKGWKRDASDIYAHNRRLSGKRAAVAKKLYVAGRFAEEAMIYFPHYLDFRGRMYPFASYLNTQADDSGRALLEFAQGKPLGENGLFWLKVHVANTFGVDKISFEERVQWVDANIGLLLDSALRPLTGQMFWADADNERCQRMLVTLDWGVNVETWRPAQSPWLALAACFELAGALIEGPTYVSHLPIAMDGSCSGLQHYSAMLRDPVGGAAVNLVPADKPGDIYSVVAERAQAVVDGSTDATSNVWKNGKVVRRIAKQPTMTLCYSATVYGMQGQIRHAIDALGGDTYLNGGSTVHEAAVYLAPVIWDAISGAVVAARDALKFLKGLAAVASSEGLPIRWTSPCGFPVVQEYREAKADKFDVIYGGQRFQLTLSEEGTRLDKRRQAAGVAPNFVHSLDAAHLMSTVNLGATNALIDWAVVHDSFGVHAADVDTLHACVRETFIEQYTPDVLTRLHSEVTAQLAVAHPELLEDLPDVPAMGTLDLAAVRESDYFFA